MLVALCAATPEISSAVTALMLKQHDVGVGIIIGSNIFNLAALLGITALIAGRLPIKRQALVFNGAVSVIVTLILVLLIFRFISPLVSIFLLAFLMAPYAIVSGLKSAQIKQLRLPLKIRTFLTQAITSATHNSDDSESGVPKSWSWAWMGGATLIVIIVTCMGMVRSAVFISNIWGLNKTILGVLVLAIFTGIPDVITAIKLALDRKGLAVMSEAINSNTLNILFGICIPATVFGVGTLAGQTVFSAWWLIGMTFIAMFLLYFKKGFSRINGAIIAALYLVFGIIIFNWK